MNVELKRLFAGGCLIGAALLGGCTAGDDEPTAQAPAPAPAQDPGIPKQPEDAGLAREGTSGKAVLETFRFIQLGAIPPAVLQYDPVVREQVGIPAFAGAVQNLGPQVTDSSASLESVETVRGGALALLRVTPRQGPPQTYSYFLRKRGGRWKVVYDTFMEGGLRNAAVNDAALTFGAAGFGPTE
jgi:hypothetical protein